jgi:biopolymer transport protein ExbD
MPKVQSNGAGAARRGRRVASSLAEINVVPLVDVMLVLLIIFMITAPMIQRGIDVNLPVARRSAQIAGERIFVSIPVNYRESHIVYLDQEPIRAEILQERVRQKMERAASKEVFLRGDGSVRYQELMEIFDRLRGAGVEKIGMVSRLPEER